MSQTLDPFAALRRITPARIGIGRAGDAQPTSALLEFQLAHSRARDAVHGQVDFAALAAELAPLPSLAVRSQVGDRLNYLQRPDLGRRLRGEDLPLLTAECADWDAAIVVADGLSAAAVQKHAAAVVRETLARLPGWRFAPIVLATGARVALGDEIGSALGASLVVVLIGERPGLSAADSLGIYLTWAPRIGRRDADRNCISNIHGNGLSAATAADLLAWLMNAARERRISGVDLKLGHDSAMTPPIVDQSL